MNISMKYSIRKKYLEFEIDGITVNFTSIIPEDMWKISKEGFPSPMEDLEFEINGITVDFTSIIPEDMWKISKEGFPSPMEDLEFRKKLKEILSQYLRKIEEDVNENLESFG